MANTKLTDTQRDEIAGRFVEGEDQAALAKDYGVCVQTISKVCRKLNAVRSVPLPAKTADLTAFAKRARSILWAQNTGTDSDKKVYKSWNERVELLMAEDGGGLTKNEAIVRASKEYPCLNQLFREYNVRAYDPNPESHPRIRHFGEPEEFSVECEGTKQTYRESLRWAIDAAGKASRTGEKPESCPCDTAWYLYKQAVSDPKDFLSRVGQVESKGDAESEERMKGKVAEARSISEIDKMLLELEYVYEGEDDNEDVS